MKKLLLLLIIPFLSFGQEVDLEIQKELIKDYYYVYDFITPQQAYANGYAGIGDFYITNDNKYLAITHGFKPTSIAIYDFETFDLVGVWKCPGWSRYLYYFSEDNLFAYVGDNSFLNYPVFRTLNLKTDEITKKRKSCFSNAECKLWGIRPSEEGWTFRRNHAFQKKDDKLILYRKNESKNIPPSNAINIKKPTANYESELNLQGEYFALIIGVDDYPDETIPSLQKTVQDAKNMYNTLIDNYTFEKNNVTILTNPTLDNILSELDHFASGVITEDDNFLIFYAGHGYWDEKFSEGFWLPQDAKQQSRSKWLPNSTIQTYLRGIGAKNTLLITDACFGGSILTRSAFSSITQKAVLDLYYSPSSKAITSGHMAEVPDKSVFIEYLLTRLNENPNKYLPAETLFSSFKIAVINNSSMSQIPQYGTIRETGDEGGDFIFIKK